MSIILDGTTGITTPGLTNTGTETILNLTTTGNTILGDATTDTLNVGAGGLVKDASGNVGIGTASPSSLLHISKALSSTLTAGINIQNYGTFTWGVGIDNAVSSTSLAFQSSGMSGTTRMVITSGGYVGIGTTSPGYGIDLVGGGGMKVRSSAGYNGAFIEGGNGSVYFGTLSSDNIIFYQNTERMRIDSSGNLGLGVTPSAWASTYTALQVKNFGLMSKNDSSWQYTNAYYDGSNKYVSNGYAGAFDFNGAATGGYAWRIAPSGTAGNAITFTQAMTLDANGNLLIGTTTSGSYKLDVTGVIRSSASVNPYLALTTTGSSTTDYIQADSNGVDIWASSTRRVTLSTNGTERMRIDTEGYLQAHTGTGSLTSPNYHSFRTATSSNTWVMYQRHETSTAANAYGTRIEYRNVAPNGTSNEFLLCNDSSATRATIRSNGGLANYSANNVNLSDERTKTDIELAGGYLDKICAIPVKTFKYKDQTDDQLNLGVIAQDVEAVAPELVDVSGFGETPEDGVPLKAIYQTDLQYALMKAIQELKAEFDAYKATHP